jgi:hypothetical protein
MSDTYDNIVKQLQMTLTADGRIDHHFHKWRYALRPLLLRQMRTPAFQAASEGKGRRPQRPVQR